jgi:acetylornithine deacetylase/succinyl-diaminopimelate desuccinylase-like protein
MIVPYGTDANSFRSRGVKSYGFTPAILPADVVASMHGDAEHVPLEAIGPAIQILFDAISATARK